VTGEELVRRAIRFEGPERVPLALPEEYGNDFAVIGMNPSVDARPSNGLDEWGALWENIGISSLGEVKEFPLKSWAGFASLKVPDVDDPARWAHLPDAVKAIPEGRFILAEGVSLYERAHFLRGLANLWTDMYTAPEELSRLLDVLVDMNLRAIRRFAGAGAHGYFWCDDWGLQDRLMISPAHWRQFWKPRYARVFSECHKHGILTFLHSCGNIVEILDDLIDAGLDVIQMDQQENMGLELLGRRFRGRITFWCPVDIQRTMARGNAEEIRAYCRRLVTGLGTPGGGFIARWYSDPSAAGHSPDAVKAMCGEFVRLGKVVYSGGGG